jgi:hypothetical protein
MEPMQPTSAVRRRAIPIGVLSLLLVAALGCDDSRIRAYSAPKDTPETSSPAAATPAMATPGADVVPVWDLPQGWQEKPGTGMRYATIVMGTEENAPEIRVTPLGSMAGEPLPNVNRWLDQLGQPPIQAGELGTVMRTVSVGSYTADLIRLEGPAKDGNEPQQILAAILPVDERVWFFMTQGARSVLAPRAKAFDGLVQSVRMQPAMPAGHPPVGGEMGSMPAGHPPVGEEMGSMPAAGSPPRMSTPPPSTTPLAMPSSGGPGGLSWKLPPGWVEMQNTSNMRLATFQAGSGGNTAEVTITRFPGDVGGELANVNRWHRQLGLPPVQSLSDEKMQDISLATDKGTYLDLTGPSSRMLVVYVSHGGFTWFLKMTGGADVLGGEKSRFESFVHSVSLPGEAG